MAARIFSTLALWAIAAAAIIYGRGLGLSALICALALAVNAEICAMLRKAGVTPKLWYIQTATVILMAISAGVIIPQPFTFFFASLVLALLEAAVFIGVLKDPFGDYFQKSALPTAATILVCPFMLQFYAMISGCALNDVKSPMFALWIIAAAKFSDVGAYVIGCAFGRHKMAPSISPKKTWEGAAGGIASSAVIGAAFAWIGGKYGVFEATITPLAAAIMSAPIGAAAIVSDLLESVFKRRMGVKDSGASIPGIGGALDLADSLILCAPLAVILFLLTAVFRVF